MARRAGLAILSALVFSCNFSPPESGGPGVVSIDPGADRQVVDGFGMSTAWGSVPSAANMDAFFSLSKGAGFSILRNRIPFRESVDYDDRFVAKVASGGTYVRNADYLYSLNPDGSKTFSLNWNNWDLAKTRNLISLIKANADYQVSTIFSTPWTPPNNAVSQWKIQSGSGTLTDPSNYPERGGMLAPSHYADYADLLADYARGFQANMGMPLAALSLQNEPNFKCSYESADWSDGQFHDFIGVLKTEFAKKGVDSSLDIIAPEDPLFRENLIVPTLEDGDTAAMVDIVGVHGYDLSQASAWSWEPPVLSVSQAASKRIWMTEWSTAIFPSDFSIDPALVLARMIHLDFTQAGINAFIYWWSSILVDSGGKPSKQLWVLGQFSRWIRPGWYRVECTARPFENVLVSAWRDPARTRIVVVAINLDSVARTVTFDLGETGKFVTVQGVRTSATENMASLETLNPDDHAFSRELSPRSVSTWNATVQ